METQTLILPFDAPDMSRLEEQRAAAVAAEADRKRRAECHGCAEDWPVQKADSIAGIHFLMHRGPRKEDGAMWCRRPELHPENRGVCEPQDAPALRA